MFFDFNKPGGISVAAAKGMRFVYGLFCVLTAACFFGDNLRAEPALREIYSFGMI
jgi:hypothetical protein